MWTWQHSGLDCAGGPEPGIHYRVEQTARVVVGVTVDGDPIYALLPVITTHTTDMHEFEAYTPAVGEVAIVTITAIDPAGNEDCGP